MKSFLNSRDVVFQALHAEIFSLYNKQEVLIHTQTLSKQLLQKDIEVEDIEVNLNRILAKTETYNILLTLVELEKRLTWDETLLQSTRDLAYNQHRTIAINICDMYGSGATAIFGYVDIIFKQLFPNQSHTFLSKGIAALIASTIESIKTYKIIENYSSKNLELLQSRGVNLNHLSELVFKLQIDYNPTLTMSECERHVLGVLRKQQTYHAIDLCIRIDKGVENKEFGEQFTEIVGNDEGLYGTDEAVNMSVSKLYGMISITNFGYLDKVKPGIIGKLDSLHEGSECNTFIDDTVCAIVAAACARLAHNHENTISKPKK